MLTLSFIPKTEFKKILKSKIAKIAKLQLFADMCRLNTLSAIKKAGSGHLGSSFSSMDIVVYLYLYETNILKKGVNNPNRDIYFSSKGHDCPAYYSVLAALGIVKFNDLINLRKIKGLPGHPEITVPGVEANSGSLGMGISKAKGMALAKKLKGYDGRIFAMTGDGELQEGQIWESLQTTAHQKINNICIIIDHNKIQTDKPVEQIISLANLEKKIKAFNWYVERCDGHNFTDLEQTFAKLRQLTNKPKIIIADTIKGKGVSFMEKYTLTAQKNPLYKWHSGAPSDEAYLKARNEILKKINTAIARLELTPIQTHYIKINGQQPKTKTERIVDVYAQALVDWGEKREDIIVLDADLSADCGLRPFEKKFPDRFVENGIAEQDMVSMAGGLALQKMLPIINTFGAFLGSRANEQIYNNATENTKIIYVCHYAGLIPAGPGKSHQSVRDIALFATLPNCVILEPCNAKETKQILSWCIQEASENCMIRLVITPSPQIISLPDNYQVTLGKGVILKEGTDVILFAYGPIMLNEALLAHEILKDKNISLKVVNLPWLNKVNKDWLEKTVGDCKIFGIIDNHFAFGGLKDTILRTVMSSDNLKNRKIISFAINDYPAWGTSEEVLNFHKLNAKHISTTITNYL